MATVRGGERFERVLHDIAAQLSKPAKLRLGFLENARYPDGTSVAMIAEIQDYGAPRAGIPPRPFFRNMVVARSPDWPKGLAANLKATRNDVEASLRSMGEHIRGQLQQSIRDTNVPPLKPATVARKGFDKPLIETSHMINSVDFEVSSS